MSERLLHEIQQLGNFSKADLACFSEALVVKSISKGDFFLKEGQISREIGYLKHGLVMHYTVVDGIEIPIDFTKEEEWVAYLKSFTSETASDLSIKALEDTELLVLTKTAMEQLFGQQPKFMILKSYYVEQSLVRNVQHASNLATMNAKERYHKFVEEYADLPQRMPQYLIARYLGIKPQSLSRLRKSD